MCYKFNSGNGAWLCDHCRKTILDYLPMGYVESFLEATQESGRFKGIDIWSKDDKRFCSAICLKGYLSEDDSLVNILYAD